MSILAVDCSGLMVAYETLIMEAQNKAELENSSHPDYTEAWNLYKRYKEYFNDENA